MRWPRVQAVLFAVSAVSVVMLYLHGLGSARIYLSVEEVLQALQAHAVGSTGRDLTGRWMPLYPAEPWYEAGRDPIWVYAAAGLLRVAPFSEALIRLPSAAAGVLNVVLIFFVARRLFRRESVALAAAVLLALTPAHFFQSRIATSQIGPLPFLLAWLLYLLKYMESRRSWHLFAASALLGAATYSYLSAVFFTPAGFIAMLFVVARHHRSSEHHTREPLGKVLAPAFMGFIVAVLPFVGWHVAHPERTGYLIGYYGANGYNADLAIKEMSLVERATIRVDCWWDALNPGLLFFSGDGNLRFSTRYSGHFLLPTAVLFLVGCSREGRKRLQPLWPLVVVGLLLTPLPAVLATSTEIKRWLAFIPFAILVAAGGVHRLLESGRRTGQWIAIALLVICVGQFTGFLRDYWTGYRERSFFYYGGDMGGAVREILATTDDVRCVMFDRRVPILDHWLLYTRIKGLDAAAQRPNVVDADLAPITAPPGCRRAGLLIHERVAADGHVEADLVARGWTKQPILEPGQHSLLTLFWHDAN